MKSLQEFLKELGFSPPEFFEEHSTVLEKIDIQTFAELSSKLSIEVEKPDPTKGLGLHWRYYQGKYYLRLHYFIGAWWIEPGEIYLEVKPKSHAGKRIAFVQLLSEILEDPAVGGEFFESLTARERVFYVDINTPPVPVGKSTLIENFLPFVVFAFLKSVTDLVKKGLKKNYTKVTQALDGRLKGKININSSLRAGFFKGKPIRNICSFDIFNEDCLENRLIKTALIEVNKWLYLGKLSSFIKIPFVEQTLKKLLVRFEYISIIHGTTSYLFTQLKNSTFYPEYNIALDLANLILNRTGLKPVTGDTYAVQPFYINMPKLFELWVYKKLREIHADVFYQYKVEITDKVSQKSFYPDFVIPSECKISDAKYKFVESRDVNIEDLKQLSLYGRLNKIKKLCKGAGSTTPILELIYPSFDIDNRLYSEPLRDFEQIITTYIKVPTI
jgi:hypothetical protein